MSISERARPWVGRIASLAVVIAFGLGWILLSDQGGRVFLAVLLPFVGGTLLVEIGQRLAEGELGKSDLFWGLAGSALLVAGLYFVAEVGWLWLLAGGVLLALEVVVIRFLPEGEEELAAGGSDELRDEDHVIAEHAVDERARRGVPPM
jgi:hypothetical protein